MARMIKKEDIPQRIFDCLRLSDRQVSTSQNFKIVLEKEGDGSVWSMSIMFDTLALGKCIFQFKKLNRKEKQLLVYSVKRGTQKTVTW
jgi:hypothetical protein